MKHYIEQSIIDNRHPITITLIGVGGTGSHMLNALARINHALVALDRKGIFVQACDYDTVSESNLGRQVYFQSDIGRNKADIAIERVNRAFGTKWVSITRKFDDNVHSHGGANFYITCVDTGIARKKISSIIKKPSKGYHSYEKSYYWLDIGNTKNSGQIILGTLEGIVQPDKTLMQLPHIVKKFPNIQHFDNKKEQGPSCSTMEALNKQDLFINTIMANFAANMLWTLLKDYNIDYNELYYNGSTNLISTNQ